ncbi:MAG: radical SAM protein [Candidatus Omnitrophica bacterium]|nr:radical SAM protein [Candidatus Omnitrophota bacterium]
MALRPYSATINITDNCCLKCVMCNQWQTYHKDELSKDEWMRILGELYVCGVREINLTGGEPLCRSDIFEIIAEAVRLGIKVGVSSNGDMIDDEMADQLLRLGVKDITISVDAIGLEYDRLRGVKGAYQRVYRALEILSAYNRDRRMSVLVAFVLMKDTLTSYKEVVNAVSPLGIPVVVNLFDTSPYFFQIKGARERFWVTEKEMSRLADLQQFFVEQIQIASVFTKHRFVDIDFFKRYFRDPLQKDLPCYVSQIRLNIGPKGQIFGGCWSLGVHGDLRKNRLQEILKSKAYRAIQQKMFNKQCPGCSCGYITTLNYSLGNWVKELVYRAFPSARRGIYAGVKK